MNKVSRLIKRKIQIISNRYSYWNLQFDFKSTKRRSKFPYNFKINIANSFDVRSRDGLFCILSDGSEDKFLSSLDNDKIETHAQLLSDYNGEFSKEFYTRWDYELEEPCTYGHLYVIKELPNEDILMGMVIDEHCQEHTIEEIKKSINIWQNENSPKNKLIFHIFLKEKYSTRKLKYAGEIQ